MKQIDILFPHNRLDEVTKVLYRHKVGGLSHYEIKGRGRAERESVAETTAEGYRTGRTYTPEFGTRTKLEVLVQDSLAKEIIDDLIGSLSTGSPSDGKIFVKDITEAYDIGSKQSGDSAL